MESGNAMESGARDVLSLCARMNAHFRVGSGSPSCRLDSEPIAAIDSASVEAADIWIMPCSLSTPDLEKSKEKEAGSGSKGTRCYAHNREGSSGQMEALGGFSISS
uniref:Uncharacterized protein n=1 Tax=Oryza rufipogon TaxID=4529 RepID=A0A0E0RH70_ORYRU